MFYYLPGTFPKLDFRPEYSNEKEASKISPCLVPMRRMGYTILLSSFSSYSFFSYDFL